MRTWVWASIHVKKLSVAACIWNPSAGKGWMDRSILEAHWSLSLAYFGRSQANERFCFPLQGRLHLRIGIWGWLLASTCIHMHMSPYGYVHMHTQRVLFSCFIKDFFIQYILSGLFPPATPPRSSPPSYPHNFIFFLSLKGKKKLKQNQNKQTLKQNQ